MPENVGKFGANVSASVTRPANTTTYAAGDVVDAASGAGLTFSVCSRRNGQEGYINDAILIDSAAVGTKGSFELWLFNQALAAYDNDNVAFTPTDADLANLVAVIPFTTAFVGDATSGAGGNCMFHADRTYLPARFSQQAADDDLVGVLVVRNGYVPVSAEVFTVILKIEQE
jgi:hypothetical protein